MFDKEILSAHIVMFNIIDSCMSKDKGCQFYKTMNLVPYISEDPSKSTAATKHSNMFLSNDYNKTVTDFFMCYSHSLTTSDTPSNMKTACMQTKRGAPHQHRDRRTRNRLYYTEINVQRHTVQKTELIFFNNPKKSFDLVTDTYLYS